MNNYYQAINKAIWDNIGQYTDKTAVVLHDGKQTYGQLGEQARHIARLISEQLRAKNPEPGNTLCAGVCIDRNHHLIPTLLALLRLGITYVPLTPQLPTSRMEYIAGNCKMSIIITTSDLVDLLPQGIPLLCVDTAEISRYEDISQPFNFSPFHLSDAAYIIYTSGTTGRPKGVVIPYSSMYAFLSVLGRPELTNFSPDSRVLLFASINFDASIIEIFGTLFYGGTIIMATEEERTDVKLLYKLMTAQRVTFCLLPPSLMAIFPSYDFPDMEALFVGGEPMIPAVYRRALGHQYRFVNVYGPTENTVYSTMRVVTPDVSPQNIGHTFPTVRGYVLDENLNPVKTGETGELMLGGEQLATGYLNHPRLTAAAFTPAPPRLGTPRLYHTGDVVRLMADGSYEYVGRKDSQVNLHGYRIELYEIKRRIEMCTGVVKAFICIEDIGSDKQLVAYVQADDTVTQNDIQEQLRQFLPHYMVPRYFVFIKEFPRNINGKVDPTQLRAQAPRPPKGEEGTSTPLRGSGGSEEIITSVVSTIMGVDHIDPDADLIDELGLTSLQIMQATISLDFTGFYTSAKDFVNNRTIRRIAANHAPQPSYWYNQPHSGRPTLIVVSGYTSFVFLYTKWADNIADKYNIFVIESYHDTSERNILDYETIIERYYTMVEPVVDQYGCDIVTGFCLGGEMGLYLAHKLDQRKHVRPHVVVMDGEVDRDPDYRDNTPIFNFPDFTPEINRQRYEQDMTIVETTPDFRYPGRVTSILSSRFNANYSDTFKDMKVTPKQREANYGYFKRAAQYWKKRYPDCEIMYIDTDHDHYLLDNTSISFLTKYFKTIR